MEEIFYQSVCETATRTTLGTCRGGGGVLPLIEEANRDMPLYGVAFSRLE